MDLPTSHRDGPIFLNVLRMPDIPEALGLLAPRSLRIQADQQDAFDRTAQIYRANGNQVRFGKL
ncbi:MAG: hypothetical protein HY000_18655 [Planctomycetes bacterium]|nr:hypothetical protein [Planctomycetota bacterium]